VSAFCCAFIVYLFADELTSSTFSCVSIFQAVVEEKGDD